jgi:hypothetical protein
MQTKTKQQLGVVCALALVLLRYVAAAEPGTWHGQQAETFRIAGAVEKPGDWTAARLATEFAGEVKTVPFTLKGEKGEAKCVPLLAFLQAAKPRLDPKIKNHQLAFVALVRAEDGYTVAFTLGELLPQFGKRQVWLALDRNGKPFVGDDAPAQLIVPEDEKGARWVHGIRSITLIDGFETLGKPAQSK